jgi:NDP-sugar pyrophosphorylase family protein
MLYIAHRINTVNELKEIPYKYGIELDLRDNLDANIHLSHDPFIQGELFEDFLKVYNHSFIILNIKSERIEYRIIDILKKYKITNYFFLDSSFPMIKKLSSEGENNIAIRLSEYEGIDTVLNMKGLVKWVWVDCFNKLPLDYDTFRILKKNGFNICIVSPELQSQPEKIEVYKKQLYENNIQVDMICTKIYNIPKWLNNDVQIIIPMSGIGRRFIDAGYDKPKYLIDIDNKPIIEHFINLFPNESNFSFIVNNEHIENTNIKNILNNLCPHSKIYSVPINNRKGPVHAVSQIFDNIDDDKEVIVSYCDYGTYWNYNNFILDARKNNADGSIACYKGFHPHMLGSDNYAFLKETENGSMWMREIKEKEPFTDNKMEEYASNGTYYFKNGSLLKKYFSLLMERNIHINNEYYVSMVYNLLVENNLSVKIFEIENMLQWGTPYDFEIYKGWTSYFNDTLVPIKKISDIHNITTIMPMAGKGSRFTHRGYNVSKPLLDINGYPMVIEAIKCLPSTNNYAFVCLNEHLNNSPIRENILKYYPNANIIGIDETTEGQACTVEIAIKETNIDLDSPILITACDNGVYYDSIEYNNLLEDENNDIIVWSFRNNQTSKINPNMYAWLKVDENNIIQHVSCKKFIYDDPLNTHAIIGTMFYRKARYFIDGLNKNYQQNIRTNGEFYVDDVINQNIKDKLNVKVFEVDNYICWGTPDDYETYLYWQKFFNKYPYHNYFIS